MDDLDLKRMGMHIAAQLPDGRAEAIAVLNFARMLVDGFLSHQCDISPLRSFPSLRGLSGGGGGPDQA